MYMLFWISTTKFTHLAVLFYKYQPLGYVTSSTRTSTNIDPLKTLNRLEVQEIHNKI